MAGCDDFVQKAARRGGRHRRRLHPRADRLAQPRALRIFSTSPRRPTSTVRSPATATKSSASRRMSRSPRPPARAGRSSACRRAALQAALGWDAGKSRSLLKGMSADVTEYLAASHQRGDVYVAGKSEEHAPGGVSLGMIATDVDRTFIIVASVAIGSARYGRVSLLSSGAPAARSGVAGNPRGCAGARDARSGAGALARARRGAQRTALDLFATRAFCRTAPRATAKPRRSRSI